MAGFLQIIFNFGATTIGYPGQVCYHTPAGFIKVEFKEEENTGPEN